MRELNQEVVSCPKCGELWMGLFTDLRVKSIGMLNLLLFDTCLLGTSGNPR